MNAQFMLEAAHLTKCFANDTALDDLNLQVASGEIFCLLGANGAGKTTTINLFLNFITPTAGTALVNGLSTSERPDETKALLGYIPEVVMLHRTLTGCENLQYFAQLAQPKRWSAEELLMLIDRVGLSRAAAVRRVSTYSKGMRQKVAVAIALAKNAKALLLDEPTSGLDPKASNEFSALLEELRSSGMAILMATHDLFRAKECGTRLGIMKAGRLVETLTSQQVSHTDLEQIYLRHMHD